MATWRLGIFETERGVLSTVYVTAKGEPVPYELKRVGGKKILMTGTFADMSYKEARTLLIEQARSAGLSQATAKESRKGPPPRARKITQNEDGSVKTTIAVDDSGVPRITSTKYADGWRSRTMLVGPAPYRKADGELVDARRTMNVFISPDGTEYIRAKPHENADLIVINPNSVTPDADRLRYLEGTTLGRKLKKQEREDAKRIAAAEAGLIPAKKARRITRRRVGLGA